MSSYVNCRIIFSWIPEKESAELSSTFMWLKVTSVGEFYEHGDNLRVLSKKELEWLSKCEYT